MVSNVVAFAICLVMSRVTNEFIPYSLGEITDIWEPVISPAGWAFRIWGVIYPLLGLFVIYQALPSEWMIYRSDDMIYNQMNLMFALNMIATATWLPMYQMNTLWGFIVSWVIMLFILTTDLSMMVISMRNEVWWLEVFLVRVPLSMYAGWITVATILNTVFML